MGGRGQPPGADAALARQIILDQRLDKVETMAVQILKGFNAGTSYGEIWIRDFNTLSMAPCAFIPGTKSKTGCCYFSRFKVRMGKYPMVPLNPSRPMWDTNTCIPIWPPGGRPTKHRGDGSGILINPAIKKFLAATGDQSILSEEIGHRPVIGRMDAALQYVLKNRWSDKYRLVIGATTVDWGDMQAQNGWGVAINDKTKWAISIFDNAMFLQAINDFISLMPPGYHSDINWHKTAAKLRKNIRKYLWDARAQKYIPHIYLNGSPFARI